MSAIAVGDSVYVPPRPFPTMPEFDRPPIHGLAHRVRKGKGLVELREFGTWAFHTVPVDECVRRPPLATKAAILHRIALAQVAGDEKRQRELEKELERCMVKLSARKPVALVASEPDEAEATPVNGKKRGKAKRGKAKAKPAKRTNGAAVTGKCKMGSVVTVEHAGDRRPVKLVRVASINGNPRQVWFRCLDGAGNPVGDTHREPEADFQARIKEKS